MSLGPEKRTGFRQGIMAISSTKHEMIGAKRTLADGRTFRYAKAGGALTAGMMAIAAQPNSGWVHQSAPAVSVGAREITLTVTAGGTLNANDLEGGLFIISGPDGGSSVGYQYPIEGNSALAAAGASLIISLKEPIKVALTTSDYFTIIPSQWYSVTHSGTEENIPAGIPQVNVTSGYYFWALTKGMGAGRIKIDDGTLNPGDPLYLDNCAGWLTHFQNTPTVNLVKVGRLAGIQRLAANSEYAWPVVIDVER